MQRPQLGFTQHSVGAHSAFRPAPAPLQPSPAAGRCVWGQSVLRDQAAEHRSPEHARTARSAAQRSNQRSPPASSGRRRIFSFCSSLGRRMSQARPRACRRRETSRGASRRPPFGSERGENRNAQLQASSRPASIRHSSAAQLSAQPDLQAADDEPGDVRLPGVQPVARRVREGVVVVVPRLACSVGEEGRPGGGAGGEEASVDGKG